SHFMTPPVRVPDDPLLTAYLHNLEVDIYDASLIVEKNISLPTISCKVADAPPIAPITVTLPPDASGRPSLSINYQTGQTHSFAINGGTPPYTSLQWAGATPRCFTATILSPNTLVLSPVANQNCNDDESFNFDIYDSHGQHMPKTV